MADAAPPAAPKAVKPKAPKKAPTHPPISELIIKALVALKERNGSSAIAIKKWIAANEKVR
jgi:histone H1/5